jgi:hypothetical protein
MWGDARTSYNAPSRRKKERKTHIILSDQNYRSRTVKVPYKEYPAAMVFYKMGRAGLLEGLPDTVDVSSAWQLVAIADREKANDFEKKWGVPLISRFRHMPTSFARLLAKIGYCNLLCALDPGDFKPICLPYILGIKANPSYVVGGTFELAEPTPSIGYVLKTAGFVQNNRLMLMTEIRLYSNNATPTYHVVVGDVSGQEQIAAVLNKIGPLESAEIVAETQPGPTSGRDHWLANKWPLPFWQSPA